MGLTGDGGGQNDAALFGHVLGCGPLAQPCDDVLAEPVGQFTVKGLRPEESNGSHGGNGRSGFGRFGVVERHVAPIRIGVVGDGPHFEGLRHHEFEIEEAPAVNALPTEHQGAVVKLAELVKQFVAHVGHRGRVVRPTRCVLDRGTGIFDLGVKGFGLERLLEEQLRQPNAVGQHRGDDQRREEDTGDDGQAALSTAPSALCGETEVARCFSQPVADARHARAVGGEICRLKATVVAHSSSPPSSSSPQAERMSEASVRPSLSRSMRSAFDAKSGSWVTIRMEIGLTGSWQRSLNN